MKSRIVRAGRPIAKAAVPVAGAVAALGLTSGGSGRAVDDRLFLAVNKGGGRAADTLFRGVTELGAIASSSAAAVVLFLAGRRRTAVRALGAAGFTWVLGQVLKKATARARPYEASRVRLLIARPSGSSWPSSHPAVLMAFVTVAGRDLGLGPGPRAGLASLAGLVGTSRVYLGVHYPSDVVAGVLLGRAVGTVWAEGLPGGKGAIQ